MASFPASIKTFSPTPAAGKGIPYTDVLDAHAEIVAIETALLAAWTDVTYDSANFTATGGGTWTVAAGDQIEYTYFKPGITKTLKLHVILDTTTMSGTVTAINVAIPGGFTAARQCWGSGVIFDNSSTVASLAKVRCLASGTTVIVSLASAANLAAATDATYVRFQIDIETTA